MTVVYNNNNNNNVSQVKNNFFFLKWELRKWLDHHHHHFFVSWPWCVCVCAYLWHGKINCPYVRYVVHTYINRQVIFTHAKIKIAMIITTYGVIIQKIHLYQKKNWTIIMIDKNNWTITKTIWFIQSLNTVSPVECVIVMTNKMSSEWMNMLIEWVFFFWWKCHQTLTMINNWWWIAMKLTTWVSFLSNKFFFFNFDCWKTGKTVTLGKQTNKQKKIWLEHF